MQHEGQRGDTTATQLSIDLLGGFSVSVGARAIADGEWRLRRVKSLIKLLALAPKHRLHREHVMDLLWPEMEPHAAANNLHKALYAARHIFEPHLPRNRASSYLHLHHEFIILNPPGALWIDVESFRAAARHARLAQDPDAYEAALGLYTGDLAPEDRYEDWALKPRAELQALYITLLANLAALREQQGDLEAAIEALQQVVTSDPLHEEAHGALIRLLAQAGYRTLALRQYQQLCSALQCELEVKPEPHIQKLYQDILSGRLARVTSAEMAHASSVS